MEYLPDSPEAIILESVLDGMAEYYIQELSRKVKRGLKVSLEKGNAVNSIMPIGYKREGKKAVIDE
ncbi:MAG: hypothetical protein LBF97_01600 [Elusimicrobiota bacterium]|jgi:hypothetical protein|nr:hypothetical protein [Elusimicrobiota bacterium]